MTIIQSILVAIIQGLTEFLPVSSSAHIVIMTSIYKLFTDKEINMTSQEEIFFAIIIHLGTLISILTYFKKDIISIIKGLIEGIKTKNFNTPEALYGIYIIIGTLITVLIAFPLKDVVENLMSAPYIVGIFLIFTGIILLLSEYKSSQIMEERKDDIEKVSNKNSLTIKKASLIGLAQGLAIFPGFSRSGLTIACGLFTGLDKLKAAKFSFLLSVPIILGSSIFYPIFEVDFHLIKTFNWVAIITGFIVSIIVGYLCIKYFLKFLSRFSLRIFAYYCFIVGILTFYAFAFFVK